MSDQTPPPDAPRPSLWQQLRAILPHTEWGFPTAVAEPERDEHEHAGMQAGRPHAHAPDAHAPAPAGERGIALIIAIMIISVMMLFTSDLILSSQVNITLATQVKDNLKAEYVAKSGMNIATLLISSDFAYQLFQAQQNPKATSMVDGLGDMWTVLNGMPIGGETAEMMAGFQQEFNLNGVMDSGVLDQLKMLEGAFTIDVSDESQRINVNDCFQGRCSEVLLMLEALFSCPAEKQFLETKKLNPKEMAYRIRDYITNDEKGSEASGFSDKNEPYQRRTPKTMAKKAPLDSVSELRMVEGWDADMQTVFGPYLTGFPLQQSSTDHKFAININTASRGLLQCLFPESRGDCQEKVAVALKKRDDEGTTLGQPGDKTADVLKNLLCFTGGGDADSGGAGNRANWFTQATMTFRIDVEGVVGGSTKHLTAVVERFMPDPKKNETHAYRILYWRLI